MRKAALIVLHQNGIIEALHNHSPTVSTLAYRMKKHQEYFDEGREWTMVFHAHPKTLTALNHQLKLDHVVIRHGIIKIHQ